MQLLTVAFVVVIVALSIAAVKTMIPNSQASKACLLGYKATCSFTPISTVILIIADIVIFFVSKRLLLV